MGILLAPCLVPLAGRLERWQKEAPLEARLYFDVISAVTIVAAAWVMARFVDRRTLASLGFAPQGLARDLAYYLTGNLWMPIGVHFAWNSLLGPVLGLSVSGQDPYNTGTQLFTVEGPRRFTGGTFGLEGGAVVTLTTAIGILALALAWRRKRLAAEGGR
jgi:hypothetical protein